MKKAINIETPRAGKTSQDLKYVIEKHYVETSVFLSKELGYLTTYLLPINDELTYVCSKVSENLYDFVFHMRSLKDIETTTEMLAYYLKNTLDVCAYNVIPKPVILTTSGFYGQIERDKHGEMILKEGAKRSFFHSGNNSKFPLPYENGLLVKAKDIDSNELCWFFVTGVNVSLKKMITNKGRTNFPFVTPFTNHIDFHFIALSTLFEEYANLSTPYVRYGVKAMYKGFKDGLKELPQGIIGTIVETVFDRDLLSSNIVKTLFEKGNNLEEKFNNKSKKTFWNQIGELISPQKDVFEMYREYLKMENFFLPAKEIKLK